MTFWNHNFKRTCNEYNNLSFHHKLLNLIDWEHGTLKWRCILFCYPKIPPIQAQGDLIFVHLLLAEVPSHAPIIFTLQWKCQKASWINSKWILKQGPVHLSTLDWCINFLDMNKMYLQVNGDKWNLHLSRKEVLTSARIILTTKSAPRNNSRCTNSLPIWTRCTSNFYPKIKGKGIAQNNYDCISKLIQNASRFSAYM